MYHEFERKKIENIDPEFCFLSDKIDSFSRKKFKKRKPRLLKMSNSFSKSIKILKQINIEQ